MTIIEHKYCFFGFYFSSLLFRLLLSTNSVYIHLCHITQKPEELFGSRFEVFLNEMQNSSQCMKR